MPITAFKSFADTQHGGQMGHGHFISNTGRWWGRTITLERYTATHSVVIGDTWNTIGLRNPARISMNLLERFR